MCPSNRLDNFSVIGNIALYFAHSLNPRDLIINLPGISKTTKLLSLASYMHYNYENWLTEEKQYRTPTVAKQLEEAEGDIGPTYFMPSPRA